MKPEKLYDDDASFLGSSHSLYLRDIFNPRKLRFIVRETARIVEMRRKSSGVNKILVTGVSGMSIGFPVANRLKMPICVIRKDVGNSHAEVLEENYSTGDKFIFVDDFIGSGDTFNRIMRTVNGSIVEAVMYHGDARYDVADKAQRANFPLDRIHFIRWEENIQFINEFGVARIIELREKYEIHCKYN